MLPRKSYTLGAFLLLVACGSEVSGPPNRPRASSDAEGSSAAGGSADKDESAGSRTTDCDSTGTGGKTAAGSDTSGTSEEGGSPDAGGRRQGRGGSDGAAGNDDGAGGGSPGSAKGGAAGGRSGRGGSTLPGGGTGGATLGGGGRSRGTGGSTRGSDAGIGPTGAAGGGASPTDTTTLNCSAAALTGGTQHCSSNGSGTVNGLTWTIWSSGSGGCLTTYGTGGAFKATWNNSGDFLARVGLQWDETKTFDQYGTVTADYAYKKTGSGGGYSYIGVYGWSNSPLVEYDIVDDWFGAGPPTGGGTQKGTLDVDGGTYKIYTNTRNNQPSIHGNATFPQFFSVRQTARQCGHISITEHFKKWDSLGMKLGKMYEAKILVEAGGGSGSTDFTTAMVKAE